MKIIRKLLILSHRYLGIAIGLMVIMWFATGITMMYVGGMPRLTPQTRLERMPDLALNKVTLTPAQAAEMAELRGGPARAALLTVMDRPAYRFSGRGTTTVFADTGEVMDEATIEQSRAIASQFLRVPLSQVRFDHTLDSADQWTIGAARQMPQHKFVVDDEDRTEVYVSPSAAEVSIFTTRQTRMYAWISTIPHWLYFTALRINQPLWYRLMVWTSAAACVVAILGIALGFTQWRRRRPFTLSAAIPYAGWMRWHYITGVVFGVFTLTWAFSGLLSMEPFAWTNVRGLDVPRDALTGGPIELAEFSSLRTADWSHVLGGRTIKEIELARLQGTPYFVIQQGARENAAAVKRERLHQPYNVAGRVNADRVLVAADTLTVRREPFSAASLVARLSAAVPDTRIADYELLQEYDSYYYSRARLTPLPVLRVRFDDPAQTWFYIDPEMSQVLSQVSKESRLERWLYNGLHSLDFSFLYSRRPLWDIVMITLCLGGLASSAIGLLLGVRRMRRAGARAVNGMVPATTAVRPSASPHDAVARTTLRP